MPALELLAPVMTSSQWALIAGGLVLLGLILLALELLVIPGFGVVGVLGVVAVLGGGILAWDHLGPLGGLLAFGAGVLASGLLIWLFPHTPVARRLVLAENQHGFRAQESGRERLVGQVGLADTPLRPAGAATFGDERVDVVTEGVWVEAGARVRVVQAEGMRVVVEAVEGSA